ncbi:MAG TPA: SOS response-associated peptidase [Polyangiales bacterium]
MCGRTVLNTDIDAAVAHFALQHHPAQLPARFNISPGYGGVGAPWIVRVDAAHERELVHARWWLIPAWWKKPLKELPTAFNARAEEAAQKPFFRDALKRRRCLMPATGWYEYQGARGHKRAFLFQLPEHGVFGIAGIYERWMNPEDGEVIDSFAIMTTTPNPEASKIHDRMPVVLPASAYNAWLDPDNHDVAQLQTLLQPWHGALEIYETTGYGNDPRREGPDCIEPALRAER